MSIFNPAGAPLWWTAVKKSIEQTLRDVWPAPLKLANYATADLPAPTEYSYSIVGDSTTGRLNFSDGSAWSGLAKASELSSYAPLASPTFTGTPSAPTAAAGTNTTQIATTAFVRGEVAAIVDSAPTTLDTLNELAAALGDDPNFATTVTNSLAGKAALSGAAFTGVISTTAYAEFIGSTAFPGVVTDRGRIFRNATLGIAIYGAGSTYDFGVYNKNGGDVILVPTGTSTAIFAGSVDINGEARCNSLRIDASPSASAATTTHKLAINLNGTTYYILLSNV